MQTTPQEQLKAEARNLNFFYSNGMQALKSINMKVMASGDSYNDLGMITTADSGALFRAPDGIKAQHPNVPAYESYDDLLAHIDRFIRT